VAGIVQPRVKKAGCTPRDCFDYPADHLRALLSILQACTAYRLDHPAWPALCNAASHADSESYSLAGERVALPW
jgi:hypothetical protein